jgi:hypothetical protein
MPLYPYYPAPLEPIDARQAAVIFMMIILLGAIAGLVGLWLHHHRSHRAGHQH